MEKYPFLLILLFAFCLSCGADGKFSTSEMTAQDEAWSKMMEGHDIVMPLMGDIYKTSKALEELAKEAMVESSDFHPRAQQAIADLTKAEDGMMDWMAGITDNPITSVRERFQSHQEVLDFIQKEDQVIQQVAVDMQQSLQNGKNLISQRQGQ